MQQDAQSDATNSLWSLQRYVVGVNETPFSLLLRRPLTDPQKWLIMVTIESFSISRSSHTTLLSTGTKSEYAVNMYGCAFLHSSIQTP
jgi:hypothetical protein